MKADYALRMKRHAVALLPLLLAGCGDATKHARTAPTCRERLQGYTTHNGPFWHLSPITSQSKIEAKIAAVAKLDQCFAGSPHPKILKFSAAGVDSHGSAFLSYDAPSWTDVQFVYVVDSNDRVVGAFQVGTYSGPALAIEAPSNAPQRVVSGH